MSESIRIQRAIFNRMLEEAGRAEGLECCGLAAGRGNLLTHIFPATNELESPVAFEIPPRELFRLFEQIRMEGFDLLAIYHSHPAGENAPSAHDIERAYYPEAVYLIISLSMPMGRQLRAFRIVGSYVKEIALQLEG